MAISKYRDDFACFVNVTDGRKKLLLQYLKIYAIQKWMPTRNGACQDTHLSTSSVADNLPLALIFRSFEQSCENVLERGVYLEVLVNLPQYPSAISSLLLRNACMTEIRDDGCQESRVEHKKDESMMLSFLKY
jgi:hypothetical protein